MPRRMFIAVLPDPRVIEHLADRIERLGPPAGRPHMTPPDSWHITCAFLGDVEDERADGLTDALLARAAEIEPFPLRLAGVGAFPDLAAPRHWWVGVDDPTERLAALFRACRSARRESGIGLGHTAQFAHLTIARGKPAPDPGWAESWKDYRGPEWSVDRFDLMVSALGRTGARYSSVARFPLGR